MARGLAIEARLAIAYLDSGSNSLISIKSDGKVVDGLRKLISEVWDRVRFGRFQKMERKLEAAEAGIEFISMIAKKEKDGVLNPDFAAQLKHLAIHETLELFGKGATLREIQIETAVDNRKLLLDQIEVKLLEPGPSADKQPLADGPRPDLQTQVPSSESPQG